MEAAGDDEEEEDFCPPPTRFTETHPNSLRVAPTHDAVSTEYTNQMQVLYIE